MGFFLGLFAAALCVVGAASLGAMFLFSKARSERPADGRTASANTAAPLLEASEPATSPEEPPPVPKPHVEPARQAPPVAVEARPATPAEWPPARAFTARCRAPAGGCAPECTELAGGRCLDPCFIHTPDCSKDCLKADGTCGFPPPDTE